MKKLALRIIVGIFCGVLAGLILAQEPRASFAGPLTRPSEILRAHGIDLSQPSLIRALCNSDPEIRSAAAMKLAESHDSSSVPDIEIALRTESDPRAKIAMAQVLWQLHDPKGVAYLQNMCGDSTLSIFSIVEVIQALYTLGESNATCIDPVLNYLAIDSKSSDRRQAVLPALPHLYRWSSDTEAGKIVSTLEEMLSDDAPWTRMEASHALVDINAPSSLSALRNAISRESNPVSRSALQSDLEKLGQASAK